MCPPVGRSLEEPCPGRHIGRPLRILLQPSPPRAAGGGRAPPLPVYCAAPQAARHPAKRAACKSRRVRAFQEMRSTVSAARMGTSATVSPWRLTVSVPRRSPWRTGASRRSGRSRDCSRSVAWDFSRIFPLLRQGLDRLPLPQGWAGAWSRTQGGRGIGGETTVVQQGLGVLKALGGSGPLQDDGDETMPSFSRRGAEAIARRGGGAGLQPRAAGIEAHQLVGVYEDDCPSRRVSIPEGGVPPDVRVMEHQFPAHGDVVGGGDVPLRRETGR